MRFAYDFTSFPVTPRRGRVPASGVVGFAVVLVMQSFARTRATTALRRAGSRDASLESWDAGSRRARQGRAPRPRARRRVRRPRPPAVPQRHAAHPGHEPRCGDRARLLEEHVRARHRAEPHRSARRPRSRASSTTSRARASARSRSRASRCRFPLTSDGAAIAQYFRQLDPNDMPVGGTATARALEAARELFARDPKSKDHVRVIVLVTDGEDLEGDPVAGRAGVRRAKGRGSTSCRSAGARPR